jgi:hypothetical protein
MKMIGPLKHLRNRLEIILFSASTFEVKTAISQRTKTLANIRT